MALQAISDDLTVEYDGPGLQSGSMDVRDLAPSLLALSAVFQEANRIVNPTVPDVAVRMRATDRGSFVGQLMLYVESLSEVLVSQPATVLIALKELVIEPNTGLIGYLIRKRRERQESEETLANGDVQITWSDGATLTYPAAVLQMSKSTTIRRELTNVVRPLDSDDCDEVRFSSTTTETLTISADDADAFAVEDDEQIEEQTITMLLEVVRPSFDGKKWRVIAGAEAFWVAITDERFLAGIDSRQERFAKGDFIRSRVRFIQYQAVDGKLRLEREVVEVLEHRTPDDHPRLLGD